MWHRFLKKKRFEKNTINLRLSNVVWVPKVLFNQNVGIISKIKGTSWYLNNDCSRHMISDKQCLFSFEKKQGR